MLSIYSRKTCRHPLIFASALFVLGGCLPTAETDTPDEILAEEPGGSTTMHRLSGSVGDGPITDAQVRVSASDGRILETTISSASASYDITVETAVTDYPLSLLASGGTDLVTLASPDFDMKSVVKNSGENSVANLNPFTTIAVELATDLQGGVTPANVDSAMQIVVRELNSGLSGMTGNAALQSPISGSNIASLVRASEALGELVRRTRDALSAAGQNETGNSIVAALGSDLIDGKLDGRGGPRANARIAAVAGVIRGQIAIETMQNLLRVQGTDATARIAGSMGQVFSGTINPGLADLRVTAELVDALQLGTLAANVFQPSNELDVLIAEAENISAGMTSTQVRQDVSGDARSSFESAAVAIASASAADIELVNEILRNGVAPAQNQAPQIGGSPATSARVGTDYSFRPTASDADGDALIFSISGMPGWLTFNSSNGRLSGTPDISDIGSIEGIVISVTDGQDTISLPAFTLTVLNNPVNSAPTISGNPNTQIDVGVAYSFQPTASDADGDALTFSIANQPAWANFNESSGRLFGTPDATDVGAWENIGISVSDGTDTVSLTAFTITVLEIVTSNTPPTISGNPASQVLANSTYVFTPQAADVDSDALTFSIEGLPGWASFDTSNGRLSGTPAEADVATYSGIRITVSDGEDSATLGPFAITVDAITFGSATLSWAPPSLNTDGTPLTDLAGYKIYWGTTSGVYTESVTLDNPGLTMYVVENLAAGDWYFVGSSLNAAGVESSYSNEAMKVIE